MRNLLIVFIALISMGAYSQRGKLVKDVSTGEDLINTHNANFDTVYNYLGSYVNVKDFGATGDGVTDDYAAFDLAFTEAEESGKEIIIPEGYYIIGTKMDYEFTNALKLRGIGNVTLDFSGIDQPTGSLTCFYIHHTKTEIGTVLHDLSKNDTTIYLSSTTGLLKNDFIVIESPEAWSTARADYTKGEIQRIKNIWNDSTVSIYDWIYDDYDADSTITVYETSNQKSYVENINIVMSDWGYDDDPVETQAGLTLNYFNNLTVSDCSVVNGNYVNIQIAQAKNVYVFGCETANSLKLGAGYGLSLGSVQDVSVMNNNFTSARHAITISGTFPARNIRIMANTLTTPERYGATVDTHGDAENVIISNNHIVGGVNLRGINTTVKNNDIRGSDVSVKYYAETYPQQGYLIIEGNRIQSRNEFGIALSMVTDGDTLTDVIIKDNIIYADDSEGITIYNIGDDVYVHNYEISGNEIHAETAAVSIYAHNYGDVRINDNNITSESNIGVYIYNNQSDTTTIGNFYMKNNYISSSSRGYYAVNVLGNHNYIQNNIFDQGTVSQNGTHGIDHTFGNINLGSDITPMQSLRAYNYQNTTYVPDGSIPVVVLNPDTISTSGTDGDTLVVRIYARDPDSQYAHCEILSYFYRYDGGRGDCAAAQKFYVFWDENGTGGVTITTPEQLFRYTMAYPSIVAGNASDEYAEFYVVNTDATYQGIWTASISNHKNFYKIVTFKQ